MRRFLSVLFIICFLAVPATAQAQAPDATPAAAVEGHAPAPAASDVVAGAPVVEAVAPDAGPAAAPDAASPADAPAAATSGDDKASPPATDAEAVQTVKDAVQAARDGNWPLFAGLLLFLLVFAANRFGLAKKVGRKYVPWVTAGLGVGGSLALALVNGVAVEQALLHGFFASASAIALWELVFKNIMKAKSDGSPKKPVVEETPPHTDPEPDAA